LRKSININKNLKYLYIEMSEIPFRMIDLGPRKRKQELHDDVKFMLEYNGHPSSWEEDGKPIKLAKATNQQLWSRFIELTARALAQSTGTQQ